ncbi:MAG TPA: efflux RND transporter periplasmic adaptor subunit [Hyphomicrobiaceae bacterium]|nr:efflux RND transporter periplasmic adaptor subunit [Hyphomicrobiaceae bacterium]
MSTGSLRALHRQQPWPTRRYGLALSVVAALVGGCKGEAASPQEAVRPVKVAIVEAAASGRTLSYSGVVRPRVESALGFRVAGKIIERSVNVGDRIEVDQQIARLDETDLKLAENSARAAVGAARSRRDVANDHLDRAKALLPKAVISQAAYDSRRNELDAATAALDSAEAQLLQAVNAVGYARLKTDRAGIVTNVAAEPGQVVAAGQPIITVADATETEIAVAVPEQDAGELSIGQVAKVTLWAGPGLSVDGRIREIAGQADAASRTYPVRIAIPAPPPSMRLGMTASVALKVARDASPMVLPVAALTEHAGGPAVFVVDQANMVVRQTLVALAGTSDDGVRIASGLSIGDMVVTAGVQFLRDGMRIRLPEAPSQTPGNRI